MGMHGSAEMCIKNIGREFEETEDARHVGVILFIYVSFNDIFNCSEYSVQ
jgi:hypothetical protein